MNEEYLENEKANCKAELIDAITLLDMRRLDSDEFRRELQIIFKDYKVEKETTEICVYYENINDELVKKFLVSKIVKGCTERTIQVYKDGLRRFFMKMHKSADEITPDDIRYYLAMRMQIDGITEVSADNELRYLKSFYSYLRKEELVKKDPASRVDKIKCERKSKEALTEREIELLRKKFKDEREACMFEIMLSTGCRISELVGIKLEEIKDGKIVVHGKGKKDRIVFLNSKAKIELEMYMARRIDNSPWLFPSVRGCWYKPCLVREKPIDKSSVESIMRDLADRAGVERCNPHKLRRTCATFALRRGMDITMVGRMLGHEQLDTTKIYLDLDEKDLERSHEKYVL